jgi:hypothetical protein
MFARYINQLAWTATILSLGFLALCPARAAVPLNPPETFFTNIADRLLQQQLGVRLSEIQIAPSNQYDAAVHRIFQVTANIYDATTTNAFPTVFRPLFQTRSNGVFLAGFTNDASVSTLPAWLESNPYGVPMVIAMRKGLPNFNEFTIRSDITVQRKLQVVRNSSAPGSKPTGTNQMYVVGLSNYFGTESWNSYWASYRASVQLTVSNITTLTMANSGGVQTNTAMLQSGFCDIATNQWRGFDPQAPTTNNFVLALNTNQIFLSNAVYRFADNQFGNTATNNFENVPGFPLPNWQLSISNRLFYLMSDGDRILDLVVLNGSHSINLLREMITSQDPYFRTSAGASLLGLWDTNRYGGIVNGPTWGVLRQMEIGLGQIPTSNADWRSYALTQTATENDKNTVIDSFRMFCGFLPFGQPVQTNIGLTMETPFNPAMKLSFVKTWQANDPMVHSHLFDLSRSYGTNYQFLRPVQIGTNISPSSLARLNDSFQPWGGNPFFSLEEPGNYDRSVRDPGTYSSDYWNFPTNTPLAASWLGRVHRGTPWQTIYLKAEPAHAFSWARSGYDLRSHPTNDWRLSESFAMLFNTNDVRTLTSINTTNLNVWDTTLAGLTALTNDLETPVIGEPLHFQTNTILSGSPQISAFVNGIERTRTSQPGQFFADVAAFLAVPELSSASPFLNLQNSDQLNWGLNDEAYEMIPSQLLSRVRADPVARVSRRADGLELRFTAFDGFAYRVEGSIDGAVWNTVSEPHYSTNGTFTLQAPASGTMRFFRAILP